MKQLMYLVQLLRYVSINLLLLHYLAGRWNRKMLKRANEGKK